MYRSGIGANLNCQFRSGDECVVATLLAGRTSKTTDQYCEACSIQDAPQGPNKVTCGLAAQACRSALVPLTMDIQRCLSTKETGIGTELEKLLKPFFKQTEECGCEPLKANFNHVSIIEARRHCWPLSQKIVKNWYEQHPRSWVPRFIASTVALFFFKWAIGRYSRRVS